MKKCEVNGPVTHEVYKYLRSNSHLYNEKEKAARKIPWNFAKFLVSGQGKVLNYYEPKVTPNQIR